MSSGIAGWYRCQWYHCSLLALLITLVNPATVGLLVPMYSTAALNQSQSRMLWKHLKLWMVTVGTLATKFFRACRPGLPWDRIITDSGTHWRMVPTWEEK